MSNFTSTSKPTKFYFTAEHSNCARPYWTRFEAMRQV